MSLTSLFEVFRTIISFSGVGARYIKQNIYHKTQVPLSSWIGLSISLVSVKDGKIGCGVLCDKDARCNMWRMKNPQMCEFAYVSTSRLCHLPIYISDYYVPMSIESPNLHSIR